MSLLRPMKKAKKFLATSNPLLTLVSSLVYQVHGLVHLSDISWNEAGEEAIRKFRKGDLVEAVILAVDAEGNRISLGVKQLQKDPFSDFTSSHEKGAIVKGVIKAVDAKGATVELTDGVEATLKASEIIRDRVEDASKHLTVGQEIEAKISRRLHG